MNSRRMLARVIVAAAVLGAVLLATFAVPVQSWRTGQDSWQPMAAQGPTHPLSLPRRVWVDTDAACGHPGWHDPDDCLALPVLLRSPEIHVAGVSTVFGNAPLPVTDAIMRDLVARIEPTGAPKVSVHRGCETRWESCTGGLPAHAALGAALNAGPLTIVALGPLTNVAAALSTMRTRRDADVHVVAVMGRRPGHRFHPAEGRSNSAALFGHGPVFRDLNAALDPDAIAALLRAKVRLTLVPYEVARTQPPCSNDCQRLRRWRSLPRSPRRTVPVR